MLSFYIKKCLSRKVRLQQLVNYAIEPNIISSVHQLSKNTHYQTGMHPASHLEQAASRKGVLVVRCNEAYTSKTCPKCGHVHKKLGGSKVHFCPA